MSLPEIAQPIICSPYAEPHQHWFIREGESPELRQTRRPAQYFYRPPQTQAGDDTGGASASYAIELKLVNRIRERMGKWREAGYPGCTRTTLELINHWTRDGRQRPLFFAQVEAALAVIFLVEGRSDLRQGITIPRDEPSDEQKAAGINGFLRYCAKMATGSGKTTVMGMLAAWSILNKVANRADARFSDVVLTVCPNVTIRGRLRELDPNEDEASLYRTRDLVPHDLMPQLRQGRVLVTNWHVFEPQGMQEAGTSAKVLKKGRREVVRETITIGPKTTTARGSRYLTQADFDRQVAAGMLTVLDEKRDEGGNLVKVQVESTRYVESDTALVERILGREVGGKQNILVFNDEAHHAYRIRRPESDDDEEIDDEEIQDWNKEATVWVEGLDRIHRLRGINLCVDLSATPYYLTRVSGEANRPFPWVISEFGLIDAIESGLVKIPQLAVRDTTGHDIPGYFNIWHWILPKLTPAERGGKRANPKPEAILKYAHTPIAMLGGLWEKELAEWQADPSKGGRPPVFILVCKNTQLAKVMYEWLGEDKTPTGIPSAKIDGFRNTPERTVTIRVDSKVVAETDSGSAQADETKWMRFTLDTVGKVDWPVDRQGRTVYPDGFTDLAAKLGRPLSPPGRDVRCIVSVGMLTEGWDCNTVTHIIGLRPFMSQLLCEQVVGRGLRRASYDVDENGMLTEEVAKVFGVPFEVIPFKANKGGAPAQPLKRHHVHAVPAKSAFEIRFPRVEGYTTAIRNRITVDWSQVPTLTLEPGSIPPEVEVKGLSISNQGRLSLSGPGKADDVTLADFRAKRRVQELVFDLACTLTRDFAAQGLLQGKGDLPAQTLFPQVAKIAEQYVRERVVVQPPADLKDLFLAPYFGWLVERLLGAIRPDVSAGESPEVPRFESSRGTGSTAEVDYWTSRDVREVMKSHLNYLVADTKTWEQSAAYLIDKHPRTLAFAKNAGLGFAIPYLNNGQMHEYVPDFVVRLSANGGKPVHLILETKGFDPLEVVKVAAAERWVKAVNADGRHGAWSYSLVKKPTDVPAVLAAIGG
jgi:type III restriction enzyme